MAEKIHKFEAAGLGKAPFRCVGLAQIPPASLAEHNPTAYNNALAMLPKGYGCGTCNYCGQAIMNCFLINSADGKRFAVGCECVRKTGDAGLTDRVKYEQRQARRQAAAEKREAARLAALDRERQRNGGFTDYEWHEAQRENKRRQEQIRADKCKNLLAPLAAILADGKRGFRDSVAETLRGGRLPYGRGIDIALDILAKQAGRRNSKAYDIEYKRLDKIFAKAEKILADRD